MKLSSVSLLSHVCRRHRQATRTSQRLSPKLFGSVFLYTGKHPSLLIVLFTYIKGWYFWNTCFLESIGLIQRPMWFAAKCTPLKAERDLSQGPDVGLLAETKPISAYTVYPWLPLSACSDSNRFLQTQITNLSSESRWYEIRYRTIYSHVSKCDTVFI